METASQWENSANPCSESEGLGSEHNEFTHMFRPQGLPGEVLRSLAIRRPKVATLAARSSLPCCCTSEGSDVIRVFIRDVKQASRLGRKGVEREAGGGLAGLVQPFEKPGT